MARRGGSKRASMVSSVNCSPVAVVRTCSIVDSTLCELISVWQVRSEWA